MGNIINNTPKYSYNDIMVVPAVISNIEHRAECNPYDENGMLPLFTAPMDSVVGLSNFKMFEEHRIIPILPRTENLIDRLEYSTNGKWAAFSLQEFEAHFTKNNLFNKKTDEPIRALIDIANGHVTCLYELVRNSKKIYGDNIKIMVGNIANPETYRVCVESGVDFVRCSVGTGAGCITASNTSIGYPVASLINEISKIKEELIERGANKDKLTKIIADGGIRNFSDIIKALALGSDYVMIGSVFAKMLESAALKVTTRDPISKIKFLRLPIERYEDIKYENKCWYGKYTDEFISEMKERGHTTDKEYKLIGTIYAKFYGMASKAGQIAMKGKKVHTSEGIEKTLEVTYKMSTWVENFTDYMRSAMSYTNSKNLDDFRKSNVVVISNNTYNSINK